MHLQPVCLFFVKQLWYCIQYSTCCIGISIYSVPAKLFSPVHRWAEEQLTVPAECAKPGITRHQKSSCGKYNFVRKASRKCPAIKTRLLFQRSVQSRGLLAPKILLGKFLAINKQYIVPAECTKPRITGTKILLGKDLTINKQYIVPAECYKPGITR